LASPEKPSEESRTRHRLDDLWLWLWLWLGLWLWLRLRLRLPAYGDAARVTGAFLFRKMHQ
jgi:hypothetical protein